MQHLVFEGVLKNITAITKEHQSNKQTNKQTNKKTTITHIGQTSTYRTTK